MTIQSIVVADSDTLSRMGLKALLDNSGCSGPIVEIADFAELAGVLPDSRSTLLVMDTHLSGLEGPEEISDLLRRYPALRVCVLVDVSTRETALEYLAMGVMGCIEKAHSAEEIFEAIAVISEGRPYLSKLVAEGSPQEAETPAIGKLTRRQRKVLAVMATGKSNKEIARELGICEGTVKVHVNAAYRTLGVHNRVAAVRAMQQGQGQTTPPATLAPVFPELVRSGGFAG